MGARCVMGSLKLLSPGDMVMRAGWWQTFFDPTVASLILNEPREHELEFLIRELELTPEDKLFDQCCGWGRVAGPLAEMGIEVYGVDSSGPLIEAAQKRWQVGSLRFTLGDAAEFRQFPLCHAACNLYSSFAYVGDHAYNQQIINRLVESVLPAGKLLIDTINPHRVYDNFAPTFTSDLPQGGRIRRHSLLKHNGRLLHQRWEFESHREVPTFQREGETWLYSADDIASMLKEAGAETLQVLGDFQGRSYKPTSERLIVVARK